MRLMNAGSFIFTVFLAAALFFVVPSSGQNNDIIRVMIYNILHGETSGLKGSGFKVDLKYAAEVIKSPNPVIVVLQKVDSMWSGSRNQFQPKVLSELYNMPYYYSDLRSFTDTAGWGYCITILSKYRIKDCQTLFLPYNHHGKSENRVNSIVTVGFPNGKDLKFVCAHFDNLYDNNRLLEAWATNNIAQSSRIPVLLAGDLNSRPESAPIRELKKQYNQACKKCDPAISKDRPELKLDYVFYSRNSPLEYLSEQVIDNDATRFASHHRPYMVKLLWKNN